MATHSDTRSPSAALASRAIGAMFFSVFGGVWLALGAVRGRAPRILLLPIALGAAALLALALRQYRAHREAHAAEAETPDRKRADRTFNLVNAGQWLVILVVGNALNMTGHGAWVLAAAMLVIGLHFFPLAKAFRNPAHHLTGAALCAWALGYPFLLGPAHAAGCLGPGLILWASAAWAVV